MSTAPYKSFLVIQTAFIGDVILATALVEKIHRFYPEASIDFLLRKGNEALLKDHPLIREVLVWDKKNGKTRNLLKLRKTVRKKKYEVVVNAHRFASSGFITAFSGAKLKLGFDKNPLSFLFTRKVKHELGKLHEVERNQQLITFLTDDKAAQPRLYPTTADVERVQQYKQVPYLCIAPTSVWFTKQFPPAKWIAFIKTIPAGYKKIYLLGAPSDKAVCDYILTETGDARVENLCGHLSFLQSAALMQGAHMNYVNDSSPMHMASAVDAPVTAVYCSTVPAFGFGPLSSKSFIVETREKLSCRPCGLHGHKNCPEGHFKCALGIDNSQLLEQL